MGLPTYRKDLAMAGMGDRHGRRREGEREEPPSHRQPSRRSQNWPAKAGWNPQRPDPTLLEKRTFVRGR